MFTLFTKKKKGRKREIYFLSCKLFEYLKSPDKKARADLALQTKLERSFWGTTTAGVGGAEDGGLTVSLTSYCHRIETVHIVLASLFEQRRRAGRIVLWLDKQELSETGLPANLLHAKARGVEIRFCENLRSYKKIIPSLRCFSSQTLVTVDDDVMYPPGFLDKLAEHHHNYPGTILCYRGHEMTFSEKGELLPYRNWHSCVRAGSAGLHIFPTGAGGVLYPSGCFAEQVCDEQAFMALAPRGDDIWLKAMSLLKGVECRVIECGEQWLGAPWSKVPPYIASTQQDCLANDNLLQGNDEQIKKVFDAYTIWTFLKPPKKRG